jgi:HSP20 family protein
MARNQLSIFTPGNLMAGTDPFLMLHREMNRLFDDALRGGGAGGGAGGSQGGFMLAPHMDVSETGKDVRIQAELPGVAENDIEVSLNEDVLTIRAEKKQERKEEHGGVHLSERSYGTFQRSLRLPFPVNPDQVQARFENGVLHVTLPKTQPQERTRRIQVQSTQGQGAQTQAGDGQPSAQSASASQDGAAQGKSQSASAH